MDINPTNPLKVIIHKDRILRAIRGEFPPPITVGLDISNYCNNNCIWCLYKKYRKDHLFNMSRQLILKAIREMKELGVLGCCISGGGEPTMNPNLEEAILYCDELGLDSSLNTNGCRLNQFSDRMYRVLSYLRISLDAGSEESHKKLHKPKESNFKEIIDNLEKIISKKLTTVGVGYLVHPENYREIFKVAKILSDIGCDYLQVRPLKSNILTDRDKREVFEQLLIVRKKLPIKIFESFSKMSNTIEKKNQFSKCYFNRLVSSIGPDGYVYPCCELRGIDPIGNIKNESFGNIWNSSKHAKIVKNIDISKCPPCKYAKGNEIIEKVFLEDELHKNFV